MGFYKCNNLFLLWTVLQLGLIIKLIIADVDVALNQQASMNSTYTWSNGVQQLFSSASFAVNGLNNQQTVIDNGNSGTGYFPRVCSVTLQDVNPGWWMVDLGATYHITSIKIWGIPDDYDVQLSGYFNIFVMQSVNDPSPVLIGGLNVPLSDPYVFIQVTDIRGSVVKIEKNGNAPTANNNNNMLALCTVSVYSDSVITTTKTTTETSTATSTATATATTTTAKTPTTTMTSTTRGSTTTVTSTTLETTTTLTSKTLGTTTTTTTTSTTPILQTLPSSAACCLSSQTTLNILSVFMAVNLLISFSFK